MKNFTIGIKDDLWARFEKTFESTAADFLIDEEAKVLKDPSAEDMEAAEANAAAETARRGRQWINVFTVNGIRGRIMPEANAKAESDDNTIALEGLDLRKSLKAMSVEVTEL